MSSNIIHPSVLNGGLRPEEPKLQQPQVVPRTPAPARKRILVWSDSILATTGFGVVSNEIVKALHSTGQYKIDQLAINFFSGVYDREKVPINIVPARLDNPKDPYGQKMLLDMLQKETYDALFIINDTFVTEKVAPLISKIRQNQLTNKKKDLKIIYYYPVDCRLLPSYCSLIKIADRSVAYSKFAYQSSLDIGIVPTDIIYHGADPSVYFPLPTHLSHENRQRVFGIDDDVFVVMNVNRNSIRKNMPQTLLAFSEFRKHVPKTLLYLHAKPVDGTQGGQFVDLNVPIAELGLQPGRDVIFPKNYDVANGFPKNVLNQIYNCGNMFISTALGEGWGLCVDPTTRLDTCRGSVEIQNVLLGDQVLGGDGLFHLVTGKVSREVDIIYSIMPMYGTEIITTEEHPFFILESNSKEPKWLNVKDININDYVAVPKMKEDVPLLENVDIVDYLDNELIEYNEEFVWYKMGYSPFKNGLSISDIQKKYCVGKRVAEDARRCVLGTSLPSRGLPGSLAYGIAADIKEKELKVNIVQLKIKRHIPITDEFLYFLGWYLAEGSNGTKSRIELDFHIKEMPFAKQLSVYLNKTFDVSSRTEQNGKNKCRLILSGQALAIFMGKICGEKSWNKKVPDFLLKSPKSLGRLLASLFLGDGHIEKRGHSLTTTSPHLAYQVRYICSANNILTSIKKRPLRAKTKHNPFVVNIVVPHLEQWKSFTGLSFDVAEITRRSAVHFKEDDNYFYLKIKSIKKELTKSKKMFDISVEGIHSFTANGVLAHNTSSEAMSAGLPMVLPDNTVNPEILGNEERGYIYDCKELTMVDGSGMRKVGRHEDIVNKMLECYVACKDHTKDIENKLMNARKWVEKNSWQNIGKQWIKLFDEVWLQAPKVSEGEVL